MNRLSSRNMGACESTYVSTFTQIARRIAATILLDANEQRCATETWDWRVAVQRDNQRRLWTDA